MVSISGATRTSLRYNNVLILNNPFLFSIIEVENVV